MTIAIALFHSHADDFLAPEPPSQRLTNDDFRKLMMTPRAGSGSTAASGATPTPSSGSSGAGSGVLGGGAMGGQTPRVDAASSTPG